MKIHPLLSDPITVFIFQNPMPEVVQWDDYRRAATQALAAFELNLDGEKVVIKPNVTSGESFANPDTGIGTHPGFVHGMVDYLQSHGARPKRISVVEDPRDSNDNQPRHWRGTGYERLAQDTGMRLFCPKTYTCVKKPVPQPQVRSVLNVSRLAVAPGTVLLNVPKLKTHNLGITTLCMKNLMGLVNVFDRHYCAEAWEEMPAEIRQETRPRKEWFEPWMHDLWHAGLARRLIDTAQVLQPTLNIVEAVVGREGTGFQRGRNRILGLVIAGVNVVAVDSLASYLMGFDPAEIVTIRMAHTAGLGEMDVKRLKVFFAEPGSGWAACDDVSALRIQPRMHVIRNIKGEDLDRFSNTSMASPDFTAKPLSSKVFTLKK